MRIRNHLLALVILVAFLAIGSLYVRLWVVQRPFGIVLVVSDALVSRHLTAARLYADGADNRLEIEGSFPYSAIVRNDSTQFAVPDSAAAATALATGQRARHRALGVDGEGRTLVSLLELARKEGRAVGIVTNGRLTDPTPAAFYAHTASSTDRDTLAATLMDAPKFNVLLGGGADDFLPPDKGGRRKDTRSLLQPGGREIVRNKLELENAATYRDGTLLGLFASGPLAFSKQRDSGVAQPALSDLVRRAIQCLQTNRSGYVLIVDEALVAQAAEINDGENTLRETLELDRTLSTAVKYAGEKSLIIAVGRHAIGGFAFSGYPLRQDKGPALLGTTPEGNPAITWASGPKGPQAPEPSAFQSPAALNNAEDVIAVGRGLGAEKVRGFLHQTDIFHILKDAL